jgi:hypothetical protein
MQDGQFIIITKDLLPELARQLAPLILSSFQSVEDDPYLTPKQLSERIPVLSAYLISKQIRENRYGKKFGAKGKLMAKVSEAKKYNRV